MTTFFTLFLLFLFSCFIDKTIGIDATCRGKRINERCACDEDCEGPQYQCVKGKCSCPFDFEEFDVTDKAKTCRPARDTIGASCQNKCKAPLLCKDGKCICFGGTSVGNKCQISCQPGETLIGQDCRKVSTAIGGRCASDDDCQFPNSYCTKSSACDCIPGSVKTPNGCTLTCPDGNVPTQACRKILQNDANVLSNLEKMDTCPKGFGCVTFGKPDYGICCRQYCPYGSPDLTKSCNTGADCPTSTHYCQLFEDHGAKNSLCCPRPCRDPTPMFIQGRCIPNAYWGDICIDNGQCDGGSTMQCKNGRCTCLPGYLQVNNTFPTCSKTCNALSQTNIDGGCYTKVNVGDPCFHTNMCPLRSVCREGLCQCDCTSALTRGSCVNPDDPININKLGEIISKIFNPNAATSQPETIQ